MSRVAKSIDTGEDGYPHRDHRSVKGREENQRYKRFMRLKQKRRVGKKRGGRKGKWIV